MKFVRFLLLLCLLFPSCAQDDDTQANTHIKGIAASGSPIEGTVTIRDSKGTTVDCTIDDNGYFSANVTALTAPFLLEAKGSVNDFEAHYYSYAETHGQVNISQLTHATVSMAIRNEACQYYSDNPNANLPDSNIIKYFASGINLLLSESYTEVGLEEHFDFLHDSFVTNGIEFDLLLDRISLSISSVDVYINDSDTHIPIFIYDIDQNEQLYFLAPEKVAEILIVEHCSPYFQTLAIQGFMKDIYYWNAHLPELEISEYSNPESLLEAMRYSKDKWSVIVSKDVFDSYMMDSTYVGLGFYLGTDNYSNLRISFVYPDSPADNHGLIRGDIILEINGTPSDEIIYQSYSIFGDDVPGEIVDLKIQKNDGSEISFSLAKKELTITTVLYSTILDVNEKSVGYMVFNDFIMSAFEEIGPVFKDFKDNNISELILDLRYNSGGIVDIATYLASLIGGKGVANEIFCKMQYNDNNSYMNKTYYFQEVENSLDLDRLIVITTNVSSSASEALINCLKPYMDVVVIGSPSDGKPVGMNPITVCDKYLFPITFEIVNALDEGQYYDGIAVDCYALDDLSKPFGDTEEHTLKESLYFIENNKCSYQKRHSETIENKPFPLHGFRKVIGAF